MTHQYREMYPDEVESISSAGSKRGREEEEEDASWTEADLTAMQNVSHQEPSHLTTRSSHTPFDLYLPHTLLASSHLPIHLMNSPINSSNTLTALHLKDVPVAKHLQPEVKMDGHIHGRPLGASSSGSHLPKVRSLMAHPKTVKPLGMKGLIDPD
jgi:hypothetical protein